MNFEEFFGLIPKYDLTTGEGIEKQRSINGYNCTSGLTKRQVIYIPKKVNDKLISDFSIDFNSNAIRWGFVKDNKIYLYFNHYSWRDSQQVATGYSRINFISIDLNNYQILQHSFSSNLWYAYNINQMWCVQEFFGGNNGSPTNIIVGQDSTQDFLYSNNGYQTITYLIYFFIPILIFILGFKVFRKGLFK